MKTIIQRAFAPFKAVFPRFVWTRIRAISTALITPFVFSRSSGHFKSSLKEKAVDRHGHPLPWYTYSCIDLLRHRDFAGRRILEFGSGQSTLWWASRADRVVSIEGDPEWYQYIVETMPKNVELHLVPVRSGEEFLSSVGKLLDRDQPAFDVVVIDAYFREELVEVALRALQPDGALICDDAESYGFHEVTKNLDIERVDLFGYAPGVVLPHCTSIFFRGKCFLFHTGQPIPDLAYDL